MNDPRLDGVPNFHETRALFGLYRQQQMIKKAPHSNEVAEAEKRLDQVAWIVRRVHRLQEIEARSDRQPRSSSLSLERRMKLIQGKGFEVELLCEAFYYFSFRLARSLDDVDGFRGFYKKLAINAVRNHLIEHPRVMTPTFTWGRDLVGGPRLKPYPDRDGGEPRTHDRGLYINAQELIDALCARLRKQVPAEIQGPR